MLIPFFERNIGRGRGATQGLGGKYDLESSRAQRKCGDFPAQPQARPWGSPSPTLPLQGKRNSIHLPRIKWNDWKKEQKCKV
ncbi:hypothetical protein HQ46_05435 [Porphyromonas gulae]|nr:hypothetical protein HQ46_05435 [Porphyromonas gulae]